MLSYPCKQHKNNFMIIKIKGWKVYLMGILFLVSVGAMICAVFYGISHGAPYDVPNEHQIWLMHDDLDPKPTALHSWKVIDYHKMFLYHYSDERKGYYFHGGNDLGSGMGSGDYRHLWEKQFYKVEWMNGTWLDKEWGFKEDGTVVWRNTKEVLK